MVRSKYVGLALFLNVTFLISLFMMYSFWNGTVWTTGTSSDTVCSAIRRAPRGRVD